jgi:hypothetical protein
MDNFHFTVYIEKSIPRSVVYEDANDEERSFVTQLGSLYKKYFESHEDKNVNGLVRLYRIETPFVQFEEIPDKYTDGLIAITVEFASRFSD